MEKTELFIRGSAGFTFPVLTNEEILGILGNPRTAEWLEEKTGIRGHSLNLDPITLQRRLHNLTALDYAEKVAREALSDAKLDPSSLDQLVLCSCTPAQQLFWADVIELHRRLGLKKEARLLEVPGGCAALAQAFHQVELEKTYSSGDWNALVVAVNDTISYLDLERYRRVKGAWLSLAMFADGASAVVLSSQGTGPQLAGVYLAYDGNHPLVTYRGGGGLVPTGPDTLDEHTFLMDSKDVATQFTPSLLRCWNHFRDVYHLETKDLTRWYFHQANKRLIENLTRRLGIPTEKVPFNVDRFANTVSASTLLLLDEDRKRQNIPVPFIFLWVGAGMVEGGALFV